jgi:predicted dehydrogenase
LFNVSQVEPQPIDLTIGLVGCGPWGGNILRDLQSLGATVDVAARHDTTVARARAGGARFVGSLDELIARDPDGYVVTVGAEEHAEVVLRLLDRTERPIFVEKPMCDNAGDARLIANRSNGRVFVMDKWRYHAGIQSMRSIVHSGTIGAVVGIRTRRNQRSWSHRVEQAWTLAPHDLAIVEELIGSVPPIMNVVRDTVGSITYGMTCQFGPTPWVTCEWMGRAHNNAREVVVHCEQGLVVLEGGYAEALLVFRDDGRQLAEVPEVIPFEGEWPLLAELRQFAGYLRGGPEPFSTAADGLRHVEIIESMYRLAHPA